MTPKNWLVNWDFSTYRGENYISNLGDWYEGWSYDSSWKARPTNSERARWTSYVYRCTKETEKWHGKLFMKTKYPRTFHLRWSPGLSDDDKVQHDISRLVNSQDIVITEKMDGENTSIYNNCVHARSLDSTPRKDRDWVIALQSNLAGDIPDGYRLCGENLWAKHSIGYTSLPSYFMLFSVWKEKLCLSWDDTVEWAQLLGLVTVPVLYRGPWDESKVRACLPTDRVSEGYVVRVAGAFDIAEFQACVVKYVRKGHVQTDEHWTRHIERNGIVYG